MQDCMSSGIYWPDTQVEQAHRGHWVQLLAPSSVWYSMHLRAVFKCSLNSGIWGPRAEDTWAPAELNSSTLSGWRGETYGETYGESRGW